MPRMSIYVSNELKAKMDGAPFNWSALAQMTFTKAVENWDKRDWLLVGADAQNARHLSTNMTDSERLQVFRTVSDGLEAHKQSSANKLKG